MEFCPGRKATQIEGPITKVKSFTMEESTMNKREAGLKPSLCARPLQYESEYFKARPPPKIQLRIFQKRFFVNSGNCVHYQGELVAKALVEKNINYNH